MSTPTINTAATQGLAKVVFDLEHQVRESSTYTGPPELNEVMQLAETMRSLTDGDALAPVLDRIWAAAEAIDKAEAQITAPTVNVDGLLDVDPDTLTQRVLESCRDRAARDALAFQNAQHFRDALARSAGDALKGAADTAVESLRSDFDKHAKVIHAAAKAGLSEHTDPTELLEKGTATQIKAYQGLAVAVAGLDQIANLRNQMTRMLRYGPREAAVLAFVTGLTSHDDLSSAANRYEDPTEIMQYNQEFTGSAMVNIKVQRLGGRWLALVNAGHELHLNTADEAASIYAATQGR